MVENEHVIMNTSRGMNSRESARHKVIMHMPAHYIFNLPNNYGSARVGWGALLPPTIPAAAA